MTNAWLWWESQKDVKAGWIFASEVSLKSKVQLMNTTYFICILKNWTWACDHLKSSNLSADNFKKHSNSVGRYLSLGYGQAILVSGYTVLTAVSWSKHGRRIERRNVTSHYHGSTISGWQKNSTTTAKARRTAKNNMFTLKNNNLARA